MRHVAYLIVFGSVKIKNEYDMRRLYRLLYSTSSEVCACVGTAECQYRWL